MSGPSRASDAARARSRARRRTFRKYDTGGYIATFDTRPMAFVFGLVALVLLVGASEQTAIAAPLDLPKLNSRLSGWDSRQFTVTVTTTDIKGQEPGPSHLGAHAKGECRVYVGKSSALNDSDLYDRAFEHLELNSPDTVHPWRYPDDYLEQFDEPAFYVRADAAAPWKCVVGPTYVAEASGYRTVKFLTNPANRATTNWRGFID